MCSYGNSLFKKLALVHCGTKHCSKILHHVCQNNIDNSFYDGDSENKFGLIFRCSECIIEFYECVRDK